MIRKSISLLAIFAFIFVTSWQATVVVHFYANQESIEKEFCENIDKPEMNCHGQCHLKKQLKINYNLDIKSSSESSPKSSLIVFQSFNTIGEVEMQVAELYPIPLYFKASFWQSIAIKGPLDPPQFA